VSVDAFRQFITKYGVWIFAIMLAAFVVSSFNRSMGCSRGQGDTDQADLGPSIATIDKFKATAFEVDQLVNNPNQNQTVMGPEQIAEAYASSTNNVVDHLYRLALASEKGINMDDKAVEEAIPSLWSQQVQTFKDILTQEGKLKPTSTEADFEKAFQADTQYSQGMTLDQKKQKFTEDFNTAFNDPAKKELIRSEIASQQLGQKYSVLSSPSDDEVKNSFGSYKVLELNVVAKPGTDAQAVANQALNDIHGGMKFEDAIKKYSNDKPIAGKSLTDPIDINSIELQYLQPYRPLLSLKEGDVSGVIDMGGGAGPGKYTIFKVVKFTPNVPPDFQTKAEQVRKTMEQGAAGAALEKDLDALKKAGKLKWNSDAFHSMYDYYTANSGDPAQRTAGLKSVQAEAKKAMDSDPQNQRVAALAFYIATQGLYDAATPDQKKALTPDRIASLEAVLQSTESADTRMQLVDLYLDSGRTSDAVGELETAAKTIAGTSPQALGTYEEILSKLDKMSAKDQVPADKKAEIEKALSDWRKSMIEEQQVRVQSIQTQEKLDKENREALQKAQAEQAKKDAAAKKSAPATTSASAKPKGK